jgi:hypothetical protein
VPHQQCGVANEVDTHIYSRAHSDTRTASLRGMDAELCPL